MKIRKLYERFCELEKKEHDTMNYDLFHQEIITKDEKKELEEIREKYHFNAWFYLDYYNLFSQINNYLTEQGFKLQVDSKSTCIGSHPNWFDGYTEYDYIHTIHISFVKNTKNKEIIIPVGEIPNEQGTWKYYLHNDPKLKFNLYYASQYFSPKEVCYCNIPEETDEEILKVLPTIKDIIWKTIEEKYYREKEEKQIRRQTILEEEEKLKQRQQELQQELNELEENDNMVF